MDVQWDNGILETALGKEQAAKLADPSSVRTMVRREVWRPLLRAVPAQK